MVADKIHKISYYRKSPESDLVLRLHILPMFQFLDALNGLFLKSSWGVVTDMVGKD